MVAHHPGSGCAVGLQIGDDLDRIITRAGGLGPDVIVVALLVDREGGGSCRCLTVGQD
jgi:hypothetical protein